ncbi:type IV toxin-antitoxin system AbiEi family antitoxin domain-containing protein [Candidatus Poribacteria bacterium]|nr:type IV toxin-antitoxin system AbiEi family antitoxin domain-containing protein [Candidatus Poribacteria bacterium]MYK96519.1 type IV toxin-antitoxin system AbiEi family antitoxin domain-containing protein [Candidatus Poribacteria bacterium]
MTTNVLRDIISRCHRRHEKPLKQRKTILTPPLYKGLPYHFTVYCAHRYPVMLQDLEAANISFTPIGRAPGIDRPPRSFGGERFLKPQKTTDWRAVRWYKSYGIHVYTGMPSARDGAPWHDIDFTYEAICAAPDAVFACVQALVNAAANPLLTMSKSGGLRFSCRIPGYLHPNTQQARLYVYNRSLTAENPYQHGAYLEIVGEKGHNCWDARYEILIGNLLDPPMLSKEILFAPIDALRAKLHEPVSQDIQHKESIPDAPYSLGSGKLDLAKEAFFKHGFSYLREEAGFHYWNRQGVEIGDTEVSLWESEGGVWVRASTSDAGLPTEPTLITDVWKDTGILPPLPGTGVPIDDKVLTIREGKLSPLGIKRPTPVLQKSKPTEKIHETSEEISVQVQRAFDSNVRVLGFIADTATENAPEVEPFLRNNEAICLNVPNADLAAEAEHLIQKRDVGSATRWRDRMYLWDQVKDIPVDVRMATPFQRGNVCEDPARCKALEKKGGNPNEIICPQCPVYAACQERGYLSQPATLQTSKAQIIEDFRLFLDPQYAKIVEQLLKARDGTQRLCIINPTKENQLFLEYKLSKTTLEAWVANWRGSALGNFAIALLNAIEIRDKSHADFIKRLRTVTQTFEWLAAEIIQQMGHVGVHGRVVARGVIDTETGAELARWTIEFARGISAHIPLDAAAADRLAAQGLPVFQLDTFVPNENMKIPMPISDAVRLNILDAGTVENIQEFPTVCWNPDWTFWHQLQHFFAYYTRNADAPMRWEDEVLQLWVPPVLHSSVRHLLVTSPALYDKHLHRAFLDAEVEILPTQPMAWVTGNCVFQIRTGIYPQKTILELDNTWDVLGVSETGQRTFWRIQTEIERDPSIKHGIITYTHAIEHLKDIAKNENVSFLASFREFRKVESLETAFQEAQVIWIVGLPEMKPRAILNRTRILFGNDEEPLSYEMEPESYRYKDERVQNVYEKVAAHIFTEIIELAQLNRLANKKIMLITGLRIPEITDRPETHLFDWADFDVAGGLDNLAEVIATRQRFETERDNLTPESSRKEVERVLGCLPRQANRILQRMRGGRVRVTFREQILALLADGEKKTPELTAAIQGHPKAINTELTRLVARGEIVKVRRGVYRLPEP